jgi:hypothetical protein
VGDRAVQPDRDPLPGQGQPDADDVIAEADIARGVHRPLDLDHFTFLLGGSDGEFLLGEDPA